MNMRLTSVALAVMLVTATAVADLTTWGAPQEINSWAQRFYETGVGQFDFMAIKHVSGAYFEGTGFANFDAGGWTGVATPTLANASGPESTLLYFDILFAGPAYAPASFDFYAWHQDTFLEAAHVVWNGSYWNITGFTPAAVDQDIQTYSIVPIPAAVALAAFGVSLAGWVKRRVS